METKHHLAPISSPDPVLEGNDVHHSFLMILLGMAIRTLLTNSLETIMVAC